MKFELFVHLAGRRFYTDHKNRLACYDIDKKVEIEANDWDDAIHQAREILTEGCFDYPVMGGNLSEPLKFGDMSPMRVHSFDLRAYNNLI